MIDYDCGAISGMNGWEENRIIRRKAVLVPLCPPQFTHDFTCTRSRTTTVGSRRLTARAMTRLAGGVPAYIYIYIYTYIYICTAAIYYTA
jgi:hypothetical protein